MRQSCRVDVDVDDDCDDCEDRVEKDDVLPCTAMMAAFTVYIKLVLTTEN